MCILDRVSERAVALAEVDGNAVGAIIGHGEVEMVMCCARESHPLVSCVVPMDVR